ncbi:MAG: DUF1858 domain-containing protein [Candidatus Gracilibacteria bacterium]
MPKKSSSQKTNFDFSWDTLTIEEILKKHPLAAQILQDFGLSCLDCALNEWETLQQGVLGHGMPEEALKEIRDVLTLEYDSYQKDLEEKKLYITRKALLKIIELAEKEGLKTYGIRVKVLSKKGIDGNPNYAMDFEKKAKKEDKIIPFDHHVILYIDPKSFKIIQGSMINFMETYNETGFKITKLEKKV